MEKGQSNLEKWMSTKTPEELQASRLKGNRNSVATLKRRSEEKQRLLTLKDYTIEYLSEHGREIIAGIGDISRHSTSESNRIKSTALLHQIATTVVDDSTSGAVSDMRSASDAELEKIIAMHGDDIVDVDYETVPDE